MARLKKSEVLDFLKKRSPEMPKDLLWSHYKDFMKFLAGNLTEGKDVELPGIGIIKIAHRAPRVGRNPRTGETMTVPASAKLSIMTRPAMKKALNKGAA